MLMLSVLVQMDPITVFVKLDILEMGEIAKVSHSRIQGYRNYRLSVLNMSYSGDFLLGKPINVGEDD